MQPQYLSAAVFFSLCALLLTACGKQEAGTDLGKGGSIVTGSGGTAGAQNAAKELQQCTEPVAVVSLVENRGGYVGIGRGGLPESPLPLVRVIMQQSGCFRIVDRNAGLEQTIKEQELKEQGVLRQESAGDVKKGRGIVAQYTVVPSLTFSEQDAGRNIGGVLSAVGLDKVAGAAAQVKFKEAQVVLLLTDNETTEQLSSATGAARTTDLGIGGLGLEQHQRRQSDCRGVSGCAQQSGDASAYAGGETVAGGSGGEEKGRLTPLHT
jgi:hypothetical protein